MTAIGRPHRRHGAIAAAVAAVSIVTGCGISPDASPRPLPEENRALVEDVAISGSVATGADRIYLIAPGEDGVLRSVPRDAVSRDDLMAILLAGPNQDEVANQWSSQIPSSTRLLGTESQGSVFFIDLSDDITELSGRALTRAIAQIVYTASEIEGVETVQINVNGERIAWPKGNLESTTSNLRVYDYPSVVQSAQPAYPSVPSAGA